MARTGLFSSIGHAAVIATVAAVALTAGTPAVAGTGPAGNGLSSATASRAAPDFSARRGYRHGGGAAAGAFAAMAGTGGAVAASRNRGAYDGGGWRCSPVYCGPYYYGGDRYDRGYRSGTPIFPGW